MIKVKITRKGKKYTEEHTDEYSDALKFISSLCFMQNQHWHKGKFDNLNTKHSEKLIEMGLIKVRKLPW